MVKTKEMRIMTEVACGEHAEPGDDACLRCGIVKGYRAAVELHGPDSILPLLTLVFGVVGMYELRDRATRKEASDDEEGEGEEGQEATVALGD